MTTRNPSFLEVLRRPASTSRYHPLDWVRCIWKRIGVSRSLGLAAEMAFWLFMSLLPLAAVAGLVTAKLAWANYATAAPILESLPKATREMLATELGRVAAWNGGQVGIGAGLMFIWLASSGVHSVFDGIEIASTAPPRPWWKSRLLALITCVGLSIGLALVAVLGYGFGWAWKFVGSTTLLRALQLETSPVGMVVRYAVGAAVCFGLVAGLFRMALPPQMRKAMPIAPGAAFATILQITLGLGYGFYIKKAGDGGAYQAGLASIGVTLIALYLFCLALLVGIEVNKLIGDRRRDARHARADSLFGTRNKIPDGKCET